MPRKPHEYTEKEVQDMFLALAWKIIDYWEVLERKTTREKIAGAVFSLLATIDGSSTELPGFYLIPSPHPDDKEYRRSRGKNWLPDAYDCSFSEACDIAGTLHEHFYQAKKGSKE